MTSKWQNSSKCKEHSSKWKREWTARESQDWRTYSETTTTSKYCSPTLLTHRLVGTNSVRCLNAWVFSSQVRLKTSNICLTNTASKWIWRRAKEKKKSQRIKGRIEIRIRKIKRRLVDEIRRFRSKEITKRRRKSRNSSIPRLHLVLMRSRRISNSSSRKLYLKQRGRCSNWSPTIVSQRTKTSPSCFS